MTSAKRVVTATIFGLIMGIMCWLFGVYVFKLIEPPPPIHLANIIGHRVIMGFVIGISALRMNWALHGILMGLIIGSLFCLFDAYAGMPTWVWAGLLVPTNMSYGFLIEFFTTKVFKAPLR
jgi:hypothetical protein